jgi:hypothetical protein
MHHPIRSLLHATLTAALVLAATQAEAQSGSVRVKVKADLESAPDQGTGVAKMVQGDAGSFVALKTKGGNTVLGGLQESELEWNLCAYGSDKMNLIKCDKPKFVWGVGPVTMETIERYGGRVRAILSKPDPANGKLMLLDQVLDPRSLTGKAAALITEIPFGEFGKSPSWFKPGLTLGFTTLKAADGKHMLIGLSPLGTVRTAGCPTLGVMVDEQMKPLWTRTLNLPMNAVRTDITGQLVDQDGAAWYLVKNTTDAAPKVKGVTGYAYVLYRVDSSGQKEIVLDLGDRIFAQEAALGRMPDGRITCTGTYANADAGKNESVGVFHVALDGKAMKWTKAATVPFVLREVKNVQRLQNNMHLVQAWPKAAGGLYILAERAGIETHLVSELSGKKVEKTEWVSGDLHVMELAVDGSVKWYNQVPREMNFADNGPGKVFGLVKDDVLFAFFNDAEANIELRKKKTAIEPVDKPKEALMLEFKPDGGWKEKVVMKEGFKQGYFKADQIWPLAEGLYGTTAAPDFRKDRTFPILIELGSDTRH